MIVADEIRTRRDALGWSQAQLARAAGVAQQTIAAIESGAQKTSRKLPQIAVALGCSVTDLDPDYPVGGSPNDRVSAERAAAAFEVMVEFLCEHLTDAEVAGLARVFLDLIHEPLDDSNDRPIRDQMRSAVRLALRPYLRK